MSIPNLTNTSNPCCELPSFLAIPRAWLAQDPDAARTSPERVYEAAVRYVEAGLSVIPIDAYDGSKSPDPRRIKSWKVYQFRLPSIDELRAWYECGGPFGLAVICGAVSGGLEIIDLDSFEVAAP